MKSTFRLFRVAGIDIGIHYTWIFIFVFFSWSLAQGYFPRVYPGWTDATYWITGVIAALSIFISVLLHEMAHSLMARTRGIPVHSITLFILGGVSNLEEEPKKPGAEFTMAIVGPGASLALAIIFWLISLTLTDAASPVTAIIEYLTIINIFLGVFNLLPGFPLDGGRVLRSIIWSSTGDLVKATNIAGRIGQFVGWTFIGAGLLAIITTGNLFTGLWLAFIGWFLNSSADASRKETTMRGRLSHIKVRDVISPEPETISPSATVEELVANIFARRHGRAVPVCSAEWLEGIVTISDIRKIPRERWPVTPVSQIMTREPLYTVNPEDNLSTAMRLIAAHDVNQLIVNRQGQCAGLLGRADIIRYLQFAQELGIRR